MAINNLKDIRDNIVQYVNNIPLKISNPSFPGVQLDSNENFSFTVETKNQGGEQGVQLTNVRLRVESINPGSPLFVHILFYVPDFGPRLSDTLPSGSDTFTGAIITDLDGNSFPRSAIDSLVNGFIVHFPSGHSWHQLRPGENASPLTFRGMAGRTGNTKISARIIADVDLDWLFPKNESSYSKTRDIEVHSNF